MWGSNELVPLYDNEDSVCGILYNDTPYYFLKNLQGDIIAITNVNGDTVARYSYDAWGVCTITGDTSNCNIATINPFRYRGYYYDEEIAMYYLQSRYYDPMVGRFINGDDISALGVATQVVDYNLFSYCRNTPVNNHDASGSISWSTITSFFNKLLSGISKVIDIVKKFVSKQLKNYEDTLGSWQNVSAIAKEIGRSPLKVKQSLTSLIDKLTKLKNRLGKIATGITILSTIAMLGEKLVRLGNITAVMAECIMETMISAFEEVLTSSLKDLLRLIPAVGIILGLFAGSIVSAILDAVLKPARLQNVRQKIQSAIEVTAYSLKDYFIVFFKNIA